MKRKKFIKQLALGTAGIAVMPYNFALGQQKNKENETMKSIVHKADSRGHANHGWLNSYHTFSFANYHDPNRMHFGVLRVLNDDTVEPGMGFSKHPHENMEIISIPLSGDLEHKDSMGNTTVIREGDVQVMSAGTGVYHSEYNKNKDREVKFLQIWVYPNKKNVEPRYDQIAIRDISKENEFYQILSPDAEDAGVWIHQHAWFSLGKFTQADVQHYPIKRPGNGLYVFLLKGDAIVGGEKLGPRDGMGIWDTTSVDFQVYPGTELLLMDVPMQNEA